MSAHFPRPERSTPAVRAAFVEHIAGLPPRVLAAVKRVGRRRWLALAHDLDHDPEARPTGEVWSSPADVQKFLRAS